MDAIATVPQSSAGPVEPIPASAPTGRLHRDRTVRQPSSWPLPHDPRSARAARRIVRAALRRRGADEDTVDRAVLVACELVTNAVEHALPPIALRLQRLDGGRFRVEVDDGGPADREGAWTAGCEPEECGRGIGIVALIASEYGRRSRLGGATYWAVLSVG